jgi:hypothetical protein
MVLNSTWKPTGAYAVEPTSTGTSPLPPSSVANDASSSYLRASSQVPPVDLRDTVTGLDTDKTARLIAAIRHTSGTARKQRTPITVPGHGPSGVVYVVGRPILICDLQIALPVH